VGWQGPVSSSGSSPGWRRKRRQGEVAVSSTMMPRTPRASGSRTLIVVMDVAFLLAWSAREWRLAGSIRRYRLTALSLPGRLLAAAIKAGAQVIVTRNLKDFPASDLGQWEIEAKSPDAFVLDQVGINSTRAPRC
jgi:hypothetical protein